MDEERHQAEIKHLRRVNTVLSDAGSRDRARWERAEAVLDFVRRHWANQDMNHEDFRVEAFRLVEAYDKERGDER